MDITVYYTPTCPKCEELKAALEARGQNWEEMDIREPENLAMLRIEGVFTLSAPVLQIDTEYFTVDDLWEDGKLRDLREVGL